MIEDISKGISSILTLTKELISIRNDRREKTLEAITQVRAAALETRAYLADISKNPEKVSREKDMELMNLWLNAGSAIYLIDIELGDKCMMKADCWSDSRLWDSETYSHVKLDLDSIVLNCREVLKNVG